MDDKTLNSGGTGIANAKDDKFSTKLAMVQTLRGGAAVEVTNISEARVAEFAGACCVVVSGKEVPGMADPYLIEKIMEQLSIPVMAKITAGHFVEAQIVESIRVKYIAEGEIDDENNLRINRQNYEAAFVGGCRNLGEALRRVSEGSAMVRIQGDSNDIGETIRRVGKLTDEIRALNDMDEDEILAFSKRIKAPHGVVAQTKSMGRLPVVQFAAGGVTNAADAALMMQLGCDGVFVDQKIWDRSDCLERITSIVHGVKNYSDTAELARVSRGSGTKLVLDMMRGSRSPEFEVVMDMWRDKKKLRRYPGDTERARSFLKSLP